MDEQLASMSLDEKIGQMFIAGFKGEGSDEQALSVNEQARTLVTDYHVGGIIYFDRNVESPSQMAKLSNDLQKLALSTERKIPLFITVDQEGGKVARLKEGFTSFPGNMALGATRSKELAFQTGKEMGKELRAVGINLNMAPVMDVNNNPQNPVIGVRSFSENPELTAELGSDMIRGFHESKILTIAKHFPGHGDTAVDSHVGLPEIPHSMERLNQMELVPFKRAIAAGTDMVMSTHITFPALESTPGLPATLSENVLTGLLRKQLDYDGIIITDDMEMGAIVENFGTSEAAVRAVQAGADIVLVCHSLDRQTESIEAVKQAVEQGKIDEKRIDASVRRILSLKASLSPAFLTDPYVDVKKANQLAQQPDAAKIARQTSEQGVTLVTDTDQLIPLDPKQKLAVFTVNKPKAISRVLKQQGYDVSVSWIDSLSESQIPSLLAKSRQADAVLIALDQVKENRAWFRFVQKLQSEQIPVVIWGMDVPYGLSELPPGTTYIALYGSSNPLLEAGAKILSGEIKSQGLLPVTISDRFPYGWPANEKID
ncbi:beta-N-acetylhexosaminidase [Thermoactinomyces mirandus]|uniref:beta-N-acetylhexosaminidase n=1 Tax=Thermoactinomyces mirandus TaxID=2756294 RepID=UPI001C68A590|nr:beta-N-acetylhexosaminidase [Thermoactinomyces mirandus]